MHAIYHPEYKTERDLDDAIASFDQFLAGSPYQAFPGSVSFIKKRREELLYDLANRRDDGELRWISPSSAFIHEMMKWQEGLMTMLETPSSWMIDLPNLSKKD